MEEYWEKHLNLIDSQIEKYPNLILVIEDYFLYANRAQAQINSRMETPKMIGCIQYHCYKKGIRIEFQTANSVKTRWSDRILCQHKYIRSEKTIRGDKETYKYYIKNTPISLHIRDAIRHAVHFNIFKIDHKPEVKKEIKVEPEVEELSKAEYNRVISLYEQIKAGKVQPKRGPGRPKGSKNKRK